MMLEQSNIQAEELHAQKEEMRQIMEEHVATQDTSQKHAQEMEEGPRLKATELNDLREELKVLKAKKSDA